MKAFWLAHDIPSYNDRDLVNLANEVQLSWLTNEKRKHTHTHVKLGKLHIQTVLKKNNFLITME